MSNRPDFGAAAPANRFALRVYYEDTDAAGIVYYANYLKFAERARTEMLRRLGFEQQRLMRDGGIAFAVRRCTADYLLPARLDDALGIETRLLDIGAATLDIEQRVWRGDDLLVCLEVRLACLNAGLKPVRIPAELRVALAPFRSTLSPSPMVTSDAS
jgi:acyl-CoA thioester hydrolase